MFIDWVDPYAPGGGGVRRGVAQSSQPSVLGMLSAKGFRKEGTNFLHRSSVVTILLICDHNPFKEDAPK